MDALNVEILCHFHQLEIYPPHAIILFFNVDPLVNFEIKQPEAAWCSKPMVNRILDGSFFFDKSFVNKTFTTSPVPIEDLNNWRDDNKISDLSLKRAGLLFDQVHGLVRLLSASSEALKLQSQSLLDWTMGSEKYLENGTQIAEIFRDGFQQLNYTGFMGHYQPRSKEDSFGFQTAVIETLRKHRGSAKLVEIGWSLYRYDKATGIKLNGPIYWGTIDGQAPKDTLTIRYEYRPMISSYLGVAMKMFAILPCLIIFTSMLYTFMKYKANSGMMAMLIGDLFIVFAIFLLPLEIGWSDLSINVFCSSMLMSVRLGLSLIFVAEIFIINAATKKVPKPNISEGEVEQLDRFLDNDTKFSVVWFMFSLFIWPIIIAIAIFDSEDHVNLVRLDLEFPYRENSSVAVSPHRHECKVIIDALLGNTSKTAQVLIFIVGSIEVVMLFKAMLFGNRINMVKMRQVKSNHHDDLVSDSSESSSKKRKATKTVVMRPETVTSQMSVRTQQKRSVKALNMVSRYSLIIFAKRITQFICCSVLLLLTVIVIIITNPGLNQKNLIVVASSALLFVIFQIAIVIAPQIFLKHRDFQRMHLR